MNSGWASESPWPVRLGFGFQGGMGQHPSHLPGGWVLGKPREVAPGGRSPCPKAGKCHQGDAYSPKVGRERGGCGARASPGSGAATGAATNRLI